MANIPGVLSHGLINEDGSVELTSVLSHGLYGGSIPVPPTDEITLYFGSRSDTITGCCNADRRSKDIRIPDKVIGDNYRFEFHLMRDGEFWNDIDSVTLTFEKPDRLTAFSVECTVDNLTEGIWYYDTDDDDIDTNGYWTIGLVIVDASVNVTYPYEIGFLVSDPS